MCKPTTSEAMPKALHKPTTTNVPAAHCTPEAQAWIHFKLLHALTEYDRRLQAKADKGGWLHSPYAIAIMCEALNSWGADPRSTADPLGTLPTYFTTARDEGTFFYATPLNKAVKDIVKRYPHLAPLREAGR